MFDLDEFVSQCRQAIGENQPALAVRDVLERALGDPTLADAFGDGSGMKIVHHADDLTILNLVWPPHVHLFPHDHRMWAAIGIYGGQEDNAFFRRDGAGLVPSGGKQVGEGEVILLGNDVIHAVHNPRRTHTGTVHIYGGDFFNTARSQWTGEPPTEQPFDVAEVNALLAAAEAEAAAAASNAE